MTDLTILIAVIALALWPLAFLVLRIRHERKKRRDRLDRMTFGMKPHVFLILIRRKDSGHQRIHIDQIDNLF